MVMTGKILPQYVILFLRGPLSKTGQLGPVPGRSKNCLEFQEKRSNGGWRISVMNSRQVFSGNAFVAGLIQP
jgi:hypothetical protein